MQSATLTFQSDISVSKSDFFFLYLFMLGLLFYFIASPLKGEITIVHSHICHHALMNCFTKTFTISIGVANVMASPALSYMMITDQSESLLNVKEADFI